MKLITAADLAALAVEGPAGAPLLARADDASRLIEACWSHGVRAALLYPENLTPRFFDLSSGEAGSILQKLQSYQIRLALLCPPGSVRLSDRFRELLAEAQGGRDFGLFETRERAVAWLAA